MNEAVGKAAKLLSKAIDAGKEIVAGKGMDRCAILNPEKVDN